MNMTFTRSFEPLRLTASVEFSEEDLVHAFLDTADPDEDLFFNVFSRIFDRQTTSRKLELLSLVAALAEMPPQAERLNLETQVVDRPVST